MHYPEDHLAQKVTLISAHFAKPFSLKIISAYQADDIHACSNVIDRCCSPEITYITGVSLQHGHHIAVCLVFQAVVDQDTAEVGEQYGKERDDLLL